MRRNQKSSRPNRAAAALLALLAVVVLPLPAVAQQPRDLWAGIEVGSIGVKVYILEIRKGPDNRRELHEVAAKDFPGNITANEVKEAGVTKFDPDAIQRTAEAVRQAHAFAHEGDHKVPDDHIYVVASSGVVQRKAANMDQLKAEIAKRFEGGKTLDLITVADEVKYTFLGVVPEQDRNDTLYIDIGGGNTKFGYVAQEGGRWTKTTYGSIPFGSQTLLTEAAVKPDAARADLLTAVKEAGDKKVKPALEKEKQKVQARPKVLLGGGASWSMAVLEEVWKGEPGPVLGPGRPVAVDPDKIAAFTARVRDEQQDLYELKTKEPGPEQKAELQNVRKIFPPPRLVAAAAVLAVVADVFELKKDNKAVGVSFAPNSHLAWIRGYVENKLPGGTGGTVPPREPAGQEIQKAVDEIKNAAHEAVAREIKAATAELTNEARKAVQEAAAREMKNVADGLAKELKSVAQEALTKELKEGTAALANEARKGAQEAVARELKSATEGIAKEFRNVAQEALAREIKSATEAIKKAAQEALAKELNEGTAALANEARKAADEIKKAAQEALAKELQKATADINTSVREILGKEIKTAAEELAKGIKTAESKTATQEIRNAVQETVAREMKAVTDGLVAETRRAGEDIKKAAQEALAREIQKAGEELKKLGANGPRSEKPVPLPNQGETPGGPAALTIRLPGDARLWVNDSLCPLTSETRTFATPPLPAGKAFFYTIRAEVRRNGRTLSTIKRLTFMAGQQAELDLRDLGQSPAGDDK
jgi:uncharacterized protein (TIGR03000 family)